MKPSPAPDPCYGAGMFAYALSAVLFGNLITAMFIYSLWRLRRNERDGTAIILALFCCAVTVATGFALREVSQAETTTQERSGIASSQPPHPAR